MGYQIKRQKNVIEPLELLSPSGEIEETVNANLKIETIAKEYRKIKIEFMNAQKECQNQSEEAIIKFGGVVMSMFSLIFGVDGAEKILKYFEDSYTEMAVQVMPYIWEVVEPAINDYVTAQKDIIANNYDLSRKQKRKLGL